MVCFTVTFPIDFTLHPEPILCFLQITQPILWIGGEMPQQKVMEKHFAAQGLSLHFLNHQDLSENIPFHNYYAIIWHDFSLSCMKAQHILCHIHIPIIAITTNMYDMGDAEIYREGNRVAFWRVSNSQVEGSKWIEGHRGKSRGYPYTIEASKIIGKIAAYL